MLQLSSVSELYAAPNVCVDQALVSSNRSLSKKLRVPAHSHTCSMDAGELTRAGPVSMEEPQ
jgi:hypothetical protein